jgi:hypothetical protein
MNAIEAASRIAGRFDEDGIPYGIGGALALGVWGVPRATVDVDLTAFVTKDQLPRVLDSLERAGVMVNRGDAARDVARIGLFKGRLGVVVIDVFVSDHPQYADMARRLQRVTGPDGGSLSFISAEDLCVHKLLFGRHKDLADLELLLAARPTMDLTYVRSWLVQMVPAGDARIASLDDLARRFAGSS